LKLIHAFCSFGKLSVAPGLYLKDNPHILAHNASTARGCSGGCVITINSTDTFCGIHVSSAPQYTNADRTKLFPSNLRNHNLAIKVAHPEFMKLYTKIVLPNLKDTKLSLNQESAFNDYIKTIQALYNGKPDILENLIIRTEHKEHTDTKKHEIKKTTARNRASNY